MHSKNESRPRVGNWSHSPGARRTVGAKFAKLVADGRKCLVQRPVWALATLAQRVRRRHIGKNMRIALKLTAALLALVVCILGLEAKLRSDREAEVYEADLRRDQQVLGQALAAATEIIWRSDGPSFARDVLTVAEAAEHQIDITIVDINESPPAGILRDDWQHLQSDEKTIQIKTGSMLHTYIPVHLRGRGLAGLHLSTSLRDEGEFLAERSWEFARVATVIAFATGCLAMWLGHIIVGERASQLVQFAQRVGRGDFSGRIESTNRDELGQLTVALNAMAGDLASTRNRLNEEAQEKMQAMQQLRHADRLAAVGTLAAGLAHELGTPLHVIQGRCRLARRSGAASETLVHFDAIEAQSRRMTKLVRALLTFARAEPHQERGDYNLLEIVRSAANVVEPLIRTRQVTIVLPEKECRAFVSRDSVEQVLTNLFINAMQAMPNGGTITVSLSSSEHGPNRRLGGSRWLCLAVEDTGTGIKPEHLDRIFDPFFTTKDVGEGTGLGLSIAHGIIRDHKGDLLVCNTENGARFEVWLPEKP